MFALLLLLGSLIEVSVDPEDFYLVETDDDYASSDMEEEGHILLRSSLQTKEALKKIFDCEFNETITQQGFLSRSQSLSDLGIIRTFSLDLRKSPSFPSLLVLESFKLGVRSMASVYFDCANPVGFQDSVDSLGVSNVLSANALKPEYSKVEMTELNNDKEFDLCCSSPVSDNAHDVFEDCFEENDDAKCINYGFIYETENVEAVDDDIDDNVCTIPPNDLSICSENDINRDSDKMNEKDNNFVERRDFILNLADDPNFGFEKESIRCENVSMNRDEDVYSENSEFYLENYPDLLNSLHQTDDIIAGMVSDDTVNQVDEFTNIHVHPNLSSSMENLFKETGPPPSSSSSGYSSQADSSVCIVENDSPEMLRAEPLSSESYFRFNSLRSKCVTVFPPIFERSIEIPSPSFNCKESKIRVATDLFDPVVFEIETSYAPGPVKDQPELVFIDEDAGSEGSCLSWDYNCCEDHPHFISMDKEKEDTITSEPAIPRYSPLKSPSLVRKADELE